MRKCIKLVSLAVALLLGVVSAAEAGLATPQAAAPASTGAGWAAGAGVPSYASPAAQAKVNNQFASQFGIDTTALGGFGTGAGGFSPENFLNQATGYFGGQTATPSANAGAATTTTGFGGAGIPSYANPASQMGVNSKIASQFGIDTSAFGFGGQAAAAGGAPQGLSLVAIANEAAPANAAPQVAAPAQAGVNAVDPALQAKIAQLEATYARRALQMEQAYELAELEL